MTRGMAAGAITGPMDQGRIEPSGDVAVFPLPNTVFFPRTALPLHVFEPRYRAMVREVSRSSGLIAVSLLEPGWESDYHGAPPVHDVATVGRIEDLVALPDGRFNIRLVGLERVRLHGDVGEGPYRIMKYGSIVERPGADAETLERSKIDLLATQMCVARELAPSSAGGQVLDPSPPFAAVVNGACSALPLEPGIRQRLLEIDDLMERRRQVGVILDRILERLLALRGADDEAGASDPLN